MKKEIKIETEEFQEEAITEPTQEEIVIEPKETIIEKEMQATVALNIRENASLKSPILGVIPKDEKIKVISDIDGWVQHEKGWSMKKFLKEI